MSKQAQRLWPRFRMRPRGVRLSFGKPSPTSRQSSTLLKNGKSFSTKSPHGESAGFWAASEVTKARKARQAGNFMAGQQRTRPRVSVCQRTMARDLLCNAMHERKLPIAASGWCPRMRDSVVECGGKRSATPLSSARRHSSSGEHSIAARKRCRRCKALPLHLCHRTPRRSREKPRLPHVPTSTHAPPARFFLTSHLSLAHAGRGGRRTGCIKGQKSLFECSCQ